MVSPAARGLFHKGIAQSAQQTPIRGMTEARFGLLPEQDLDAKYISSLEVKSLQDLRALPTEKLMLTSTQFEQGEFGGAMIDGKILVGDPLSLFAQGKQAKVPFMIGTNSWDSSFFVPSQPSLDAYIQKMGQDPKVIEKLYAGVKDKCILSSDVMGDAWYRASTKMLADSMNGIAAGYAYYFDYLTKNIRASHPGVPHSFEITYVFGSLDFMPQAPQQAQSGADQCALIQKAAADVKQRGIWSGYWYPTVDRTSTQDWVMSDMMSKSWTAFAKTGNPNVKGQTPWPIYKAKDDVMRNFSYDQELIQGMLKERVDYQTLQLKKMFGI
jgi:para-nitrobenzyl esterase